MDNPVTQDIGLNKRIEEMIEKEFQIRIQSFCTPTSPIRAIMKIALTNHTSPQCKIRVIIEGLHCWYTISGDKFYQELTNYLIEYINIIFNNKLEVEFFRSLVQKVLDYSEAEFPYIFVEVRNRIKSLTSELNDLVTKTLKKQIATEFLESVSEMFDVSEVEEATEILRNFALKFGNSRNKDIYGVMFILDYNERINDSDNPEFLKLSTLKFAQNNIKFMRSNRIEILSSKDYINKPKPNGYSAFHLVVQGSNTPLEIQYRSRTMHENNEDPESAASHHNYKDTTFNNFLSEIVNEIYGEICPNPSTFKEEMKVEKQKRDRYKISQETPIFSIDYFARTPDREVPYEIEELNQFEGTDELRRLYEELKN